MRFLILLAGFLFFALAAHADTPVYDLQDGLQGVFVSTEGNFPFQYYQIKHDFSNFSDFSRAIYLNYSFFFLDESIQSIPYTGSSSGISHWVLSDAMRKRGFRMDVLIPVKTNGEWFWPEAILGWNQYVYHATGTSGGYSNQPISTCFESSNPLQTLDGCTYYTVNDLAPLDKTSSVVSSHIESGIMKYFAIFGGTGTVSVLPTIPSTNQYPMLATSGYAVYKISKVSHIPGPIPIRVPGSAVVETYVPMESTNTIPPSPEMGEVDEVITQPLESVASGDDSLVANTVVNEESSVPQPKVDELYAVSVETRPIPSDEPVYAEEPKNTKFRFFFWEFDFSSNNSVNEKANRTEPRPWWAFLFP